MVGARLLTVLASVALLVACRAPVATNTPATTTTVAATPRAAPTSVGVATLVTAAATVPPSVVPFTQAAADSPRIEWDAGAVVARPDAYYRIPCPAAADPTRANPGQVFNLDTPAAVDCVQAAMQANHETPEARAFLARYGVFLTAFTEHGTVDMGVSAAAWQNMGRPEPVLLNSRPGMIAVSTLVNGGGQASAARQWVGQPAYVAAVGGEDVVAWAEYATVTPLPPATGGGQRFLASMPLRKCRACADLATLSVVFAFAPGGEYAGWELRPPEAVATPTTPPRSP
jgi:hypothetical protein